METFDPSPRDVAALAEADLVVMNGLGLDAWLEPVITSAAPDVPVVRLAEDLPGVEYATDDETQKPNPHLWLNVAYADRYVEKLTEALSLADADGAEAIQAGSAAYSRATR